MALTPLQIVEARNPKYKGTPRLGHLLELATGQISSAIYGSRTNEAIALLVLHWLYLDNRQNGAGGPITSDKEAGHSYGDTGMDGPLSSTAYGQELLDLKKEKRGLGFMNRRLGVV